MTEVDVDRIKAQVTAASAARRQEQLLSGIGRLDVVPNRRAAAYLRSHLEKTGLDLQALERAAGPETPPTSLKPGPEAAQAHARQAGPGRQGPARPGPGSGNADRARSGSGRSFRSYGRYGQVNRMFRSITLLHNIFRIPIVDIMSSYGRLCC